MPDWAVELAGWVPAIVIPVATFLQLLQIVRSRSVDGVSWVSWALFGIANIGVYVFTEKWLAPQSLLGFLLSAILDFVIVGIVLRERSRAGR